MASKLVSYVHTVQLKLKIEQATLPNNDDPPPPNVMEELCAAIGRDRKNVDDAIDCLEQRLQARSPAAKQKALKLVKYMSQRGSGELQRALVRLSSQIKELQTFRCAPDAFKGDIPWKRVQEYAREALEAIHRVREADASGGISSMASMASMSSAGKRMEGFGSGNASGNTRGNTSGNTSGNANGVGTNGSRGTNAPGSGGKQRYEGFGSGGARTSSCVLEPDAEDFRDASFGAKLAMGFNELKSAALSGAVGFGDFSGVMATRGGRAQDKTPTASDGYRSAYSPPTRPQIDVDAFGEHGLASPTATRNAMVPMAGGGFEGVASPSSTTSTPSTPSTSTSTPPATPEERLVHAFVSKTAHGVRVAPTVDECGKFLSTCGGHGSIPLAKAFEKKLTNGSWKEVLRALCVLDVAATGQGTSVTPAISSMVGYFKDHPASLQRASDSAQDRVRSKAASVMARLGIECRIECAAIDAGSVAADVSVDLLSVDGTSGGLPGLLEALDVNEGVEGIELPPNSPVAGLISATASPSAIGAQRDHASTQSNPVVPFGDWLGGEQTTTSTATATATSARTGATVDPFAAMEDTRASPESSKSKQQQPILDDFFASSEPSLGPPPAASGHGGQGVDVLGAWHATTSGFTSSKREETAFDFGDLRKI